MKFETIIDIIANSGDFHFPWILHGISKEFPRLLPEVSVLSVAGDDHLGGSDFDIQRPGGNFRP